MPLKLENNYDRVSLMDLVLLREQGYSVLKSPHVGNQHPSNLVCAALGIPLEMVSFTQGVRDTNFHPHLRIENGQGFELYSKLVWTPFARVLHDRLDAASQKNERRRLVSATEYHQASVKRIFPVTEIMTDMERMQQYPALAAMVLHATNRVMRGMWYRRVSADGHVTKLSQSKLGSTDLETNVFEFSSSESGWVIPNLVHIVFDLVYQSLSSGRDVVYHLSGPQIVNYIGEYADKLELMYDAVRQYVPALPLTVTVRIVPVAAARFVSVRNKTQGLSVFSEVRDQLHNPLVAREFVSCFPEFTQPIESGATLSQYDVTKASDIKLDLWMLSTSLSEVTRMHRELSFVASALAQQAAE